MVGAAPDVFARVKPLLEMMGTTIHHCGGVGTGMRTKLVNNFLAIVSCQMNAEAIALSQRFGLSLEKTLDVIHGTTATNGQLKLAWATKVLKGDTEPGFTIDLAHKDLSLIVDAANADKVPVPIAAVAREAYSAARAQGHGGKDFSAMVDVLCELGVDQEAATSSHPAKFVTHQAQDHDPSVARTTKWTRIVEKHESNRCRSSGVVARELLRRNAVRFVQFVSNSCL